MMTVNVLDQNKGVATIQVSQGATTFLETSLSGPIANVQLFGNAIVFTNTVVSVLFGNGNITLTGTLVY